MARKYCFNTSRNAPLNSQLKKYLCFYSQNRDELKEPKKQSFNKIQPLEFEIRQIWCRNKWYVLNWQSEAL